MYYVLARPTIPAVDLPRTTPLEWESPMGCALRDRRAESRNYTV